MMFSLIAVLASHDSIIKNNELARVIEELYDSDCEIFTKFHFIFTKGTFNRIILGLGEDIADVRIYPIDLENPINQTRFIYPLRNDVKNSLLNREHPNITVLPDHEHGGTTILANLIVQRQCSIIWPFLSPLTKHLLYPENLALLRLCDLWNAKRLMNAESVRSWFRYEAKRDVKRNPQKIPLKIELGTPETKNNSWPEANVTGNHYEVRLPNHYRHTEEFWTQFEKQTIALVAHDDMKERMVDFAVQYETELSKFGRILTTVTTAQRIENACRKLKKKVFSCLSGPKGGDIEIATEIWFGRCHVVIFFIDPLHPHPHIDDIRVVFSACMAEIMNNDVRMLTNEVMAREWIEEAVRRPGLIR